MSGDGTLRRTRSTGDIPIAEIQRPGLAHIVSCSRYSESNSDATDRPFPLIDETRDMSLLTVPSTMSRSREPRNAEPVLGEMQSSLAAELPEDTQAQATVHHPVAVAAPDQHNRSPPRLHNRSLYSRTMAYFGYGRDASRARRSLVALLWNLGWGFVQIVVIISLLALSRHLESPTVPGLNEWKACDRPLGVWACLWVVRVALTCGLTYWGWLRDRIAHTSPIGVETGTAGQPGRPVPPARNTAGPASGARQTRTPTTPNPTRASSPEPLPLPHAQLYSRLTLLSSLLTLSWFLTAHILEYTSTHTCRRSSPHLWWLMFGILCIMYLMVLEVVLLGFVVFIIAPILFLFWNIFLICIGRHPIQNPTMIKPEIGKLPKSVVDRIPLVMYIPPPPETLSRGPITIPEAIYSYPPKTPKAPPAPPKRRFKFSRHISSLKGKKRDTEGSSTNAAGEKGTNQAESKEPQNWEDHWEQGDYPFVRLEGNRAACAICLMDFEEPKRIIGVTLSEPEKQNVDEPSGSGKEGPSGDVEIDVQEVPVENITQEEREEQLKLLDAGEGAQPLRLLICGHVFHKTCLDPWLTDVSGRCPVCQRAVEVPEPAKKNRRRNG